MRRVLIATCLAFCLAACGSDQSASTTAQATDLSSLPATVEGEIFFDLSEASDSGTIAASETTVASLAIAGDDGDDDGEMSVDVQVTGAQLDGLSGDGERVRATLSSKAQWGGVEVYVVSSLQRL